MVADFTSYAALGIMPRRRTTPEQERLWLGISVYSSPERARWRVASLTPPRGFIAALELEHGGPITWEQTGRDPEHYTVWGSPQELLARVRGEPLSVAELG